MDPADDMTSEADFIEANLDGIEDSSVCESEHIDDRNVAIYVQSNRGKPSLLVNGYKYRKVYNTKHGTRWNCSRNKNCSAFLYLNDKDEVIMSSEIHDHPESERMLQEVEPSEDEENYNVAVMTETKKGTVLKLNGYRYKKGSKCKIGYRWICLNKICPAFLKLKKNDEIVMTNEIHNHSPRRQVKPLKFSEPVGDTQGILVRSRNGKDNLLYKQFAYRKQYQKRGKIRWVCSTVKYCRACVFSNYCLRVISAFQEHCHDPPKYYNKGEITDDTLEVSITEEDVKPINI